MMIDARQPQATTAAGTDGPATLEATYRAHAAALRGWLTAHPRPRDRG